MGALAHSHTHTHIYAVAVCVWVNAQVIYCLRCFTWCGDGDVEERRTKGGKEGWQRDACVVRMYVCVCGG